MKSTFLFLILSTTSLSLVSQEIESPCSYNSIISRHLDLNPKAIEELEQTEKNLQKIIQEQKQIGLNKAPISYTIPVVLHVFHNGEDGKMDMEQALSGLEILNADFNGFNDGWDDIDPAFDAIKGSLAINFCLATIDPLGNPTTGLIYHQDALGLLNEGNLFRFAWDNYKYLNIYFPKYTGGAPSDFTAYAYFPSDTNTNNNRDGIFYSSIRWGYGNHSILDEGDDWASVCTHEIGHWLSLYHTFQNGCSGNGDRVSDTPPTEGGKIELEGCYNNDFSCGVATNGSNFMDYNHRCKKMFTQEQVIRMESALFLTSRENLWRESNLVETGCSSDVTRNNISYDLDYNLYPNPAKDHIIFSSQLPLAVLKIIDQLGNVVHLQSLTKGNNKLELIDYQTGLYFFVINSEGQHQSGKFIISR